MIKIEKTEIFGWRAAIRGMRNPMNSWLKSDSSPCVAGPRCDGCGYEPFCLEGEKVYYIGDNDLKLMRALVKGGDDHAKFLRMINVTADITAPRYWWPEFDTYKVGTVANSCSTMHKLTDKEFTIADFSTEHIGYMSIPTFNAVISDLNNWRNAFNNYDDMPESIRKEYTKQEIWYNMIQLLPQSYNQKRTVQLNYAVLKNMYFARKNHKLDEWHEFCAWVEGLPYFKEIVIQEGET